MADQPAKKQKTDVETMGVSEMKALIKSAATRPTNVPPGEEGSQAVHGRTELDAHQ